MPTRFEHYTRDDLLDTIQDLSECVLDLKEELALREKSLPKETWRADFIEELKSYLDWRKYPNTSLSEATQTAVEKTMLEILHKRIQEAP